MSPYSKHSVSVGMNGFGRFGLHLLRYWVLNYQNATFSIDYINDPYFSSEQLAKIIENDSYVRISDSVKAVDGKLIVTFDNGLSHTIRLTNQAPQEVDWLDKVDIFFECSGKYTNKNAAEQFLRGRVRHVLVSATVDEPDHILIYGFNHSEHTGKHRIISYGSCTVNAYVPLAAEINRLFGVGESDVHVIHNIPEYQLQSFDTLERRSCTLELIAPKLLSFISKDNFTVKYTTVPYSGISIIDYRFKLLKPGKDSVLAVRKAIRSNRLAGLYGMVADDTGPEAHKFTPHSAVIIESSISLVGDNLYMQAYFDNENSVNRYFDTANHVAERLKTHELQRV